ncbi:hypothetical protein GUJ93_ZPchr0008g14191 [Zizania palustris]|uniref:Uncharacterized protein n=1 Tax=Zizania palustris TaxID=103762 RepID=A0A8J5V3W9_ZIZPA|nr:hypothetical protein GUJ93_ZPchr0008g14191 [Zizania palustris]
MAVASGTAFSVRPPAVAVARPCAAAGGARFRADGGSGGGKWWAPLLGWSGQPDYIDAQQPASAWAAPEEDGTPTPTPAQRGPRKFGLLTEEKARQLRARIMATESFHDAMYHSAIASRLASTASSSVGKP